MKRYISKYLWGLVLFMQVQLFLSLVSLPILVAWGLPISTMTAAGNFLFNPFLSVFLLFSSLIFFTELAYIPNGWLIFILEYVTKFWLWCLSFGQTSWLFGFCRPSLTLLTIVGIGAFLIMQHKRLGKVVPSLITLSLLCLCTTFYLMQTKPKIQRMSIPCGKKAVTITVTFKKVTMIDNGALASNFSPSSWVQYTLLPELAKKTGQTKINHVIITNPNGFTFEALSTLCQHAPVTTIYMPWFTHTLPTWAWRKYFEFARIAKEYHVKIRRIKQPEPAP